MPTFPITVDATNNIAAKPAALGPYQVGTARYLTGGGGEVFKSVDVAHEVWIQQDIGNTPNAFNATSCLNNDGVTIHIVYVDGNTVNFATVVYDTNTDTFGTPNASAVVNPLTPTACIHRASDDTLISFFQTSGFVPPCGLFQGNGVASGYIIFTIGSSTWGAVVQFDVSSLTGCVNPPCCLSQANTIYPISVVQAGSFIHVFFEATVADSDGLNSFGAVLHQSLSDTNVQGTLKTIPGLDVVNILTQVPTSAVFDSASGNILLALVNTLFDPTSILFATATNSADLTFSVFTTISGDVTTDHTVIDVSLSVTLDGTYLFWRNGGGVDTIDTFLYKLDAGSGFGTTVTIGSTTSAPVFGLFSLSSTGIAPTGYAIAFKGTLFYWEQSAVPPVPLPSSGVIGGGGVYFPRYLNKTLLLASIYRMLAPVTDPGFRGGQRRRSPGYSPGYPGPAHYGLVPLSAFFLFPNEFDICLSLEWRLYNLIDRELLSCAKKPDCFLLEERAWIDAPPGFVDFNPAGAIPLPDPADGDVVVFSFRVPTGYDGVITAQYNAFTQVFNEGSGDIAWRVRVDGRLLRDCGNILVTLGSSRTLSPVHGGLQLRSGNLVEYVVTAPDSSGTLVPGLGNILAGLHGYFYPRH